MLPIFLASVSPFAGKNVVALGLAQKLRAEGKSVGYFKPIGPLPIIEKGIITDEDAVFFKKALNLQEPLDLLCPLVLSDETIADLLRGSLGDLRETVLSAFRAVSHGKDVVVAVNMGRLSSGLALGYPMHKFIRDVQAKVIVVDRYRWPVETLDGIVHIKNMVSDCLAGVVFNRIPGSRASAIDNAVRPFLKSRGVDVLGMIPDDSILAAVPLSQLVEDLGAKVLCGGDRLDSLAEHFSIGAMNPDAALRFFQRVPNKVVITGGDRADIQLAALQTSTRGLILTGDLYPSERILARAEEAGVVVLLVPHDTSTTAERCEELHGYMSLNSERKIARVNELTEEFVDWAALLRNLGLK